MSTRTLSPRAYPVGTVQKHGDSMRSIALAGRILFSAIFVLSSLNLFSNQTISYAAQQGVPLAQLLVPLSGLIALAGGLSILLGYYARLGAWLLVLFLVPVTLTMHKFWGLSDPMMAQMQLAHFMKNFAMMGSALLISYFGAGPLSLDNRVRREPPQTSEAISGQRAA